MTHHTGRLQGWLVTCSYARGRLTSPFFRGDREFYSRLCSIGQPPLIQIHVIYTRSPCTYTYTFILLLFCFSVILSVQIEEYNQGRRLAQLGYPTNASSQDLLTNDLDNYSIVTEQTATAHTMTMTVASYPGLLTPEFVTCSTNVVKLITRDDVLDAWRSGTFPE